MKLMKTNISIYNINKIVEMKKFHFFIFMKMKKLNFHQWNCPKYLLWVNNLEVVLIFLCNFYEQSRPKQKFNLFLFQLACACLLGVSMAAPKPDLVYANPLATLTSAYSAATYPAVAYPAAAYSTPFAYVSPYTAASSAYYFTGPYTFLIRWLEVNKITKSYFWLFILFSTTLFQS